VREIESEVSLRGQGGGKMDQKGRENLDFSSLGEWEVNASFRIKNKRSVEMFIKLPSGTTKGLKKFF